jgi:hypothetical protein
MAAMFSLNAALYLPISTGMLDAVLAEHRPFGEALSELPIPQISSLIVIQRLHTNAGKALPPPERMLSETIQVAINHTSSQGKEAFLAACLRILDRDKIRAGCELLSDHKILLLTQEDVAFRSYLLPDGTWNPSFCERHRVQVERHLQHVELPTGGQRILTLEQTKVYLEIKGHTDDHLHVQGYAGTGKSFLVKSLLMAMQEKKACTLVLAEHQRQLDALLAGTQGIRGMCPRTFGALVREMIRYDLTNVTAVRMHQNHVREPDTDSSLIRHLGIHESGLFTPDRIAQMVRETVRAFCASDDREFGRHHIPPAYDSADQTTRQVVLHHATELWKAVLIPPTREFEPRVHDYHRVKWAALTGLNVPKNYTHILIDECHDLARPMMQILNRCSQPAFSLGDDYQNLQGQPRRRSVSLRHREVTHSVRAGCRVEELVMPLVRAHPSDAKPDFHGNPLNKTEITYYDKPFVPDRPTVVLVSDMWSLFEWSQRMAQKIPIDLLSNARNLNVFASDFIDLYHHKSRPRHDDLLVFQSWDDVLSHHRGHRTVERIDAMLREGYGMKNWGETFARIRRRSTSGYALGLVDDARNREFDSVMLTPDFADAAWDSRNFAQKLAAVYVAVTRAQRQLFVPRRLRGWIEQVAGR